MQMKGACFKGNNLPWVVAELPSGEISSLDAHPETRCTSRNEVRVVCGPVWIYHLGLYESLTLRQPLHHWGIHASLCPTEAKVLTQQGSSDCRYVRLGETGVTDL